MPVIRARSLLLDTNIWLDYFLGTGASIDEISRIIELGASGIVELFYAPTSAKDLFYLIPRRLKRASADNQQPVDDGRSYLSVAWACVERMMELATAAPQSHAECQLARMLRSEFLDFEDNLIIAAAETAKVDYIVTNDRAFLRALPEACVAPARALKLANAS